MNMWANMGARLSANSTSIPEQLEIAEPRKLGLNQVYPDRTNDSTKTDIDIVAIHGLDTQSPRTWVAWKKDGDRNSGEVHWLQDRNMLPSVISNARIFTYDWNANFDKYAAAQGLLGHADELLEKLHIRRSDSCNRPIIFVASCFGGLLLCKALHRSFERQSRYQNILDSTVGVAFLGTPFQGSHCGFLTATQLRLDIAISMGGETADELVKYLSNNEGERRQLDDVVQLFCEMVSNKSFSFPIRCFYETHKTDFKNVLKNLSSEHRTELGKNDTGILVAEHSACLQGLPRSPLQVRHSMLNKFVGPEDPAFESVSYYLKEFAEKALKELAEKEKALQMNPDAWIRNKHYTPDKLEIKRLSGDLLSMEHCYINLAIVEQPGRYVAVAPSGRPPKTGDTPQSSPFSLHARLKIETPSKDIQVALSAIFNERKTSDDRTITPRRILVRGRAGVGKTTLCKKMVYDFIRGTWKDLFDRVLWVPLRRLKSWNTREYTLTGLFHHEYFTESGKGEILASELRHTIDCTTGAKTLFILDGLDEVTGELHSGDNLRRLLGELLNQPNVIITSRPSGTIPRNLKPLDLELETIGFYPSQVKEYIEKAFADPDTKIRDSRMVGKIQSFLQDRLVMQNLVRIPVQLDALCYTWDEASDSEPIPETMTAVYQAIEHQLWKKDVRRLEKKSNGELVTRCHIENSGPSQIDGLVKTEIDFLEALSFTGLHGDVIDFEARLITKYFKLPATFLLDKALPRLSFLRTSDPLAAKHSNRNFHFLHLTFQEYFAARYFVRRWEDGHILEWLEFKTRKFRQSDPVNYLRKHKYNARYDIFWRFVAGLLQAKGSDDQLWLFFHTIEENPRDLLGPVHQRLVMHCLSEVAPSQETPKFSQLREDLEGQLKQWLLFECNFAFKMNRRSRLVAEMEFPEQILEDVLKKESKDGLKMQILVSLMARPRVSPTIMKLTASCLGDDDSIGLKRAALAMLQRLREALPKEILQAVVALFEDPEKDVRSAAAWAFERESALPKEILQAIVTLFKDPEMDVRYAAAGALKGQSDLPKEILQAMVALFKDPEKDVRSVVVWAFEKESALPKEILQAIVTLFKDPEMDVQTAAMRALNKQSTLPDEILQAIVALLKDPVWTVWCSAAGALGGQSALPKEILQTVMVLFKDPKEDVRSAAAWALKGKSALPKEILQAVVALLKDPEWTVRCAAAGALEGQSALPKEILQTVMVLFKDPKEDVRSAAAWALEGQLALPKEILQAVMTLFKDSEQSVQSAAMRALKKQSALPEEIFQAVVALLKDPKWSVRSDAIRALEEQSTLPEEILQAVVVLLKDPEIDIRYTAVRALERQSTLPEEILQAVVASLKDPVWTVRFTAVRALERQSTLPEEILQAVVALLKDPEKGVWSAAIRALERQSTLPEEILQAVAALLKDPVWTVRSAAVGALERQSTLPEEILQAVVALLNDPEKEVRSVAAQVMDQLLALPDERFSSFLLKINSQSFNNLYRVWLGRSFSDHLTWYAEDKNYSITMSQGSRKVPLDQLERTVQEAQASLNIPHPEYGRDVEGKCCWRCCC
ncbi:armadillo-type protein [Rhexocercosporidium sp. MPI-PUGE-AT-0058]|nr:armadillo-type protein [Rhexocercosporidium sp. MPI-PUGE-AT-0058]